METSFVTAGLPRAGALVIFAGEGGKLGALAIAGLTKGTVLKVELDGARIVLRKDVSDAISKARGRFKLDGFTDTDDAMRLQQVRDAIFAAIPKPRLAGLVAALCMGDQNAIDPDDWPLWFKAAGVEGIRPRGAKFDSTRLAAEAAIDGSAAKTFPAHHAPSALSSRKSTM